MASIYKLIYSKFYNSKLNQNLDINKFQNILNLMQINIQDPSQKAQQSFFFQAIANKNLQQKQVKQSLVKWGLSESLKIGSYRFSQHFQEYDLNHFLLDLFNSSNIRYINSTLTYPVGSFTTIQSKKQNCSFLSLQIFDKLQQQGLVKNDYIQKCMNDYYEGIEICDQIRDMLIVEESQHYCLFNQQQRKQLLLQIFQMLLIGGSLNQYEDKLTPYTQITKKIYKALVSVRKRPETSEIFVQSLVYKIKSMDGKMNKSTHNPQDFTYVVINPSIRTVHVLTNQWIKFW